MSLSLHYVALWWSSSIIKLTIDQFLFSCSEENFFFLLKGAVEEDGCSGGGSAWRGREDSGGRTTSPESPD